MCEPLWLLTFTPVPPLQDHCKSIARSIAVGGPSLKHLGSNEYSPDNRPNQWCWKKDPAPG